MRTNAENHCTDSAHFWVHFPALFRNFVRELARSSSEKARKYGLFHTMGESVSRLDLGRCTKVTSALFLSYIQKLSDGLRDNPARPLHGFCTTFAPVPSPPVKGRHAGGVTQ